jgi:large subunit ribosomal protein L3
MKAILGRKIGMTQVFDDAGRVIPVTVIEAGPCMVVQRKTVKTDGYEAVQLSFGTRKRANKPQTGHFRKVDSSVGRFVREFRVDSEEPISAGSQVTVNMFQPGDTVKVSGHSKGRGFTGGIKRWGFSGGDETHGNKSHRRPGSMGCASTPSRTYKGRKLPGRMGNSRVTVRNIKVVTIDEERNLILLRGAVPGSRNGFVAIEEMND